MKNSFVKTAFIVTFILCAGYNVLASRKPGDVSDLMMANIEALANAREAPGGIKGYSIPGETKVTNKVEYDDYTAVTSETYYTCMSGGSEDCYPHTEFVTIRIPKNH